MELVDPLEVLGLGEDHHVGVAAGADQREGAQQMILAEVLTGGDELALVLLALGVREPAPGGVDVQERVLDEMARRHLL